MKPPDAKPPKGRQTLAQLRALQRLAGGAILRSLGEGDRMQPTWVDGRDMQVVTSEFIKPNDRLTSFERLEIYNRQYWFRLVDCIYDDYPGLLAILGNDKFYALAKAYLARYPSTSFTLRNLGRSLVQFLLDEPRWAAPYQEAAVDMARFEWAQVVAFDGPSKPALTAEDLSGRDPAKLRLGLQPYLTLLDLAYPLDDFSLALKRQGMRSEASNAMDESAHATGAKPVSRPRKRPTFVAVHRLNNDLYFKRLEPAAFRILAALRDGRTIAEACEAAVEPRPKNPKARIGSGGRGIRIGPETIGEWFANWTTLGWLCKPG